MKELYYSVLFVFISINCFGQKYFAEGYFLDNQDRRINCLIKNDNSRQNPTGFKYKLSENEDLQEVDIKGVKEFSLLNSSKYVKADVDIDISASTLSELSRDKNPSWQHKQVFLKVLIEGKANLYYYYEGSYERFFYSSDRDTTIEQLIYKEYYRDDNQTAYNVAFRQQLFSSLGCPHTTANSITKMDFDRKELEKYFHHYNSCMDSTYKIKKTIKKRGEFKLALASGVIFSSLSVDKDMQTYISTDFDKKVNPKFSCEIEYIMPFYNSKWGLVIGSTFQSYQAEKQTSNNFMTADFKSIDLALGLKHYYYINDETIIFASCYINSLAVRCFDSKIGYKANTSRDLSYLNFERYNPNIVFGVGFEYKRIFTEISYFTNQNLLVQYPAWNSSYSKIAFSIGYKILQTRRNK